MKGVENKNEIYDKAAIRCVGNALNLSESAELVYKSGKVGLGSALLVLACEELAKGQHYRSIADGLATTDVSKLGETWVFSYKMLYEHELKQSLLGFGAIFELFNKIYQEHMDEIVSSYESLNLSVKDILNNTSEVGKKLKENYKKFFQSNQEFEKKTKELKELIKRMEIIKERGFYVDIRNGKVVSPTDISSEEYLKLKNHFDTLFLVFGSGIAGISNNGFEALYKRIVKEFAKKQSRPMMEDFKRGSISKK